MARSTEKWVIHFSQDTIFISVEQQSKIEWISRKQLLHSPVPPRTRAPPY